MINIVLALKNPRQGNFRINSQSDQAWARWKTQAISKSKNIVSVFEIAKSMQINIVSKFYR